MSLFEDDYYEYLIFERLAYIAYLGLLQNTPLSSQDALRVIQSSTRVPVLKSLSLVKIETLQGGQPRSLRIGPILLSFAMLALGVCLQFVEARIQKNLSCERSKNIMTTEDQNAFLSILQEEQSGLLSSQDTQKERPEGKLLLEKIRKKDFLIQNFDKDFQKGNFIVPSYVCFEEGCTVDNSEVFIELKYDVLEDKVIRPFKNVLYKGCNVKPSEPLPALPVELNNLRDQILSAMPSALACVQTLNQELGVSVRPVMNPDFPSSLISPRMTVETFYRQLQSQEPQLAETWIQCLLLQPSSFSGESSLGNVTIVPRPSGWAGNPGSSRKPIGENSTQPAIDKYGNLNPLALAVSDRFGYNQLSPWETTPFVVRQTGLPHGRVTQQPQNPQQITAANVDGKITVLDRTSFVGSFSDSQDIVSQNPGQKPVNSEQYIRDQLFNGVDDDDSQVVVQSKVRQNFINAMINLGTHSLGEQSVEFLKKYSNATISSVEDLSEELRKGFLREQQYKFLSQKTGAVIDFMEALLFGWDDQKFMALVQSFLSGLNIIFAMANATQNPSFDRALILNVLSTKAFEVHNLVFQGQLLWRTVSYSSLPHFEKFFRSVFRGSAQVLSASSFSAVPPNCIAVDKFYGPRALEKLAEEQLRKSQNQRLIDLQCYLSNEGLTEAASEKVSIQDVRLVRMTSFYNFQTISIVGAILGFLVKVDILKDRTLNRTQILQTFTKSIQDLGQTYAIEDIMKVNFDEKVLSQIPKDISDQQFPVARATQQFVSILQQAEIAVSKGLVTEDEVKTWNASSQKDLLSKNENFIASFRSFQIEALDVPLEVSQRLQDTVQLSNQRLERARKLSNQVIAFNDDDITKMNANVLLKTREDIVSLSEKLLKSSVLRQKLVQSIRVYLNNIQEFNVKMESLTKDFQNPSQSSRAKQIQATFFLTKMQYEEQKQYVETLQEIANKLPILNSDFENQIRSFETFASSKENGFEIQMNAAKEASERLRLEAEARQRERLQSLSAANRAIQQGPPIARAPIQDVPFPYVALRQRNSQQVVSILTDQARWQQIQGPIRSDQFGQSWQNAQRQTIANSQAMTQSITQPPSFFSQFQRGTGV